MGDDAPRSVVSAVSLSHSVDDLTDRLAVLLCNVKPTAVKGVQSQALLITAFSRYVLVLFADTLYQTSERSEEHWMFSAASVCLCICLSTR